MAKTGVRGKWAAEVKNLAEMKTTFREVSKAVGERVRGSYQFQKAAQTITDGYQQAALLVRNTARKNAQSGGAPRRLYQGGKPAIFAFFDFESQTDNRRQRSAMVGVRTGLAIRTKDPHLFISWGMGHRRRKDNSVAERGLAMSFGALFERGTKNRRIRGIRYFKRAIFETRGMVLRLLKNGYAGAFDSIQRQLDRK